MTDSDPPYEIRNGPCPRGRLVISPNANALKNKDRQREDEHHDKTRSDQQCAEPPVGRAIFKHDIRDLLGDRVECMARRDHRYEGWIDIAFRNRRSLA